MTTALRIWLMGGSPPYFHASQNMAAFTEEPVTRILTLHFYAAAHAWLLLVPYSLCYDWASTSIPLLTSFADPRILAIILLYAAIGLVQRYL